MKWKDDYSRDITLSSGYKLVNLNEHSSGLTAKLELLGEPANAFGYDIKDLVIEVEYQTKTRLHVHIYDQEKKQFQIPHHILPLPAPSSEDKEKCDLKFNYTSSPFAFWISRTDGSGDIVFDTRSDGLPIYTSPMELVPPPPPLPPRAPAETIDHDHDQLQSQDRKEDAEGEISFIQTQAKPKPIARTEMPGHPLIFSDQYLQLSTSLPPSANIYGFGEDVATSGFRRDPDGAVMTLWNRDSAGSPPDENMLGSHPFYLEVRSSSSSAVATGNANANGNGNKAHGVFLRNSHGMDILLRSKVMQYRLLGGTFDMYFFSGPSPLSVIEQYSAVTGLPAQIPYWAFGFHLCRWGWKTVEETKGVVESMEKAGIPLETIWNDLDYMVRYRNFTLNEKYSPEKMKAFLDWIHSRNQHFVPIVDAAIGISKGKDDPYPAYDEGKKLDVFIKNQDGSDFVGTVWPGPTVFPDWTSPKVDQYWKTQLEEFHKICAYDGIWLDMNEPASFNSAAIAGVDGELSKVDWNGMQKSEVEKEKQQRLAEELRQVKGVNTIDVPPYQIHNAYPQLGSHTVGPNCPLADGSLHYNAHNLFGYEENLVTRRALEEMNPGKRPFILSRSTFTGIGRVSAHWLGDNYSTWESMRYSIQGVLNFQLFQCPVVGPDACGFSGDTTEELAVRWMQLSAFFPFYRNHNAIGDLSQEPYRWESVAATSRQVIAMRYRLLPYWESLFAQARKTGTPPLQPLFFEFQDPKLLNSTSCHQFMVGPSLLVTPVVEKGATSVTGHFPSRDAKGAVSWRSIWDHSLVDTTKGDEVTIPAPLQQINVHIRCGSIILIHRKSEYTLTDTRKGDYALLVHLDDRGCAYGEAILDDGISIDSKSTAVTFSIESNKLHISCNGNYPVSNEISEIQFLEFSMGKMSDSRGTVKVNGRVKDGAGLSRVNGIASVLLFGIKVGMEGTTTVEW